jgi:hypothetical protein
MTQPLTLNLSTGSVRFNFSAIAATELKTALTALMAQLQTASASTSASGPRSQAQSMEYRHTGEVFLEVFCNPNIWPSPFAAQVLITLRDDRIRLTTEAALSQLYDDINSYLENQGS